MFDTLASTLSQGTTSLNSDGELVIRSALSRYVLWSIVGLLAVVVARLLWRKRRLRPFSVGSYFLAIIALVVVVPGFLNETIRVSPTKVSWRGGIWFYPNSKEVSLIGIKSVRELRVAQRPPKSSRIFWIFDYLDSSDRIESFGDLFTSNRAAIAEYLRGRGVQVIAESEKRLRTN